MPFPLRFPLAFDGKLLGQVLRIFTDTVASWYRKRHALRGRRHLHPARPPPTSHREAAGGENWLN
jgi:hypothetical protein